MNADLQHRTVLLREAVAALAVKPSGTYLDGTFGRGGHSRAILEQLGPDGRLLALDRDPQAVAAAREISDSRFTVAHRCFGELTAAAAQAGAASRRPTAKRQNPNPKPTTEAGCAWCKREVRATAL